MLSMLGLNTSIILVIRRFTHRPPGNGESDAAIAFWLRKGHSAGKPLPQLAIREDAKFFVQNWTKKLFFANKDPKTNFDDWMILQKHVLSFKCNDFFKMANLKAISSSATLNNILTLGILHSAISHRPGCFCPWTFFKNIEFNIVSPDPFMSHLATQPGYSTGEFQVLQLIVLAAFGVAD